MSVREVGDGGVRAPRQAVGQPDLTEYLRQLAAGVETVEGRTGPADRQGADPELTGWVAGRVVNPVTGRDPSKPV